MKSIASTLCCAVLMGWAASAARGDDAQASAVEAPPPASTATGEATAQPRERLDVHRREMQRNAAGEVRQLREPLFDGYALEFEHSIVFEDVREQAGFKVREYELALRLVQPRVAMAELMQRLLDAGFTVEEPIGPPGARVLRFWRQGRTVQDARFSVHVGERALSPQPSPAEQGATGVLLLRLYERIEP